uniref:Uncharacterized protein n=1 Tax=Cucumis melo TaxID=3656 RepID=A0A9I9EKS3_CUCME
MIFFELPQIHGFLEAISVLTETSEDEFDLKFSPAIFSIMVAASPSSRCIISLQLSPQIFRTYVCPTLHHKFLFFRAFCDTMQECQSTGFSSLIFSFQEQDPHDTYGCHMIKTVRLYPSSEKIDVGEFDFGTFVSIESQEFINIIKRFVDFDNVLVTLSSSQVKFSYGRTEIILTQESIRTRRGDKEVTI